MKTFITVITLGIAIITLSNSHASDVSGLISFSAGTPARAADVNANFNATKTAVNDNNARVAALEQANALLQSDNNTLNARLAALEAKLESVSVVSVNNQPTVRFEGVNVQIVNGLNATDSINGTGNLIVGYDEVRTIGNNECSLGIDSAGNPITDALTCAKFGGIFAVSHKSGSHNLVVGRRHNYSSSMGVVFGEQNTINSKAASVIGGEFNNASGIAATVSGGSNNVASGITATVSGGSNNAASGRDAAVSGGTLNTASGGASSVSGGNGRSSIGLSNWSAGALFQDF